METLNNDMSGWLCGNDDRQWIVNLDIDHFFTNDEKGNYYQLLTDEFVRELALSLKSNWSEISVLTIALSPELRGGWDKALRVARIVTKELGITDEWMPA